MADIFGTVASAISTVQILYESYKDIRDRLEKASRNPHVVEELACTLERLSTQLGPIAKTSETNHINFSEGYLEVFQSCIGRLLNVVNRAQEELEDMREKLKNRVFRLRKAKTTSEWLSQLLLSAEKADREILIMTSCFANAELITRHEPSGTEKDTYRPSFDVEKNPPDVVLDYASESDMQLDEDAISHLTIEARLKHAVLRRNRTRRSVGMAGMSGVGKSCALRGLATDELVQQRFPDGVYLLVLGKDVEEADIVRKLGWMLKKSGGKTVGKSVLAEMSMKGAMAEAKEWFSSKCILLLIDDIWERGSAGRNLLAQLEEIVDRETEGRVAFTTRELRVASRGEVVHFPVRNESTASKIVLKAAGLKNDVDEELGAAVSEVLKFCGGLPMALSVIGRAIRLRHSVRKGSMTDAWNEQLRVLRRRPMSVLGEEDPAYVHTNLSTALDASLSMLDETAMEKRRLHLPLSFQAMYRGLIVIRRQNLISVDVLGLLWNTDELDATEVIQNFAEMSLAERKDVMVNGELKEAITLHDLQLDFVENACQESGEESKWPTELLQGWLPEEDELSSEQGLVCRSWWKDEVFTNEEVRNNVCRLLRNAGLNKELEGLLLSPQWTAKRLISGEILELEEDFRIMLRELKKDNERSCKRGGLIWSLRMVLDAARLCAPYVSRNGREVWFQLYARLVGYGEMSALIKTFLRGIVRVAERPWIKPSSACLPEPGGALFRTLPCKKGLRWISASNDGKTIIAYSLTFKGEVYRFVYQDGILEEESCVWMETAYTRGERVLSSTLITAMGWTKVGQRAVTGHASGLVQVWDMESGEAVCGPFRGHDSRVICVAWSPDGRRVVSAAQDDTVRVWDLESEDAVGEPFRGHSDFVSCVAWSQDGRRVASGSQDKTLRIWDVESGQPVGKALHGHNDLIRCVAWSGDGRRLASGSNDKTIRVWDVESQQPVGDPFHGHSSFVECVAWSEDCRRVASGSLDTTVRVWDVEDREALGDPFRGHNNKVSCVAFIGDGRRVVSGSLDKTVRVWDLESGNISGRPSHDNSDWVICAASSKNGRRVAVGCGDNTLRVWDMASGVALGEPFRGHSAEILCVKWSPDGTRVASGSKDNTIRIWHLESGESASEPLLGHSGWVDCVAWSCDGSRIASGSVDKTVRVWDSESGKALGEPLSGHCEEVLCVAWSSDGDRVASGSWDGTVMVWDVQGGTCLKSYEEEEVAEEQRCMALADGEESAQEMLRGEVPPKLRYSSSGLVYDNGEGEELLASLEKAGELHYSMQSQRFAVMFQGSLCFMELVE